MTLRARVVAGAVVVAVVLAVGAAVTTRVTERHLLEQVDARLEAAAPAARRPGPGPRLRLSELWVGIVTGDGVTTVAAPDLLDDVPLPDVGADEAVRSARTGEAFTVPATATELRYRALAGVRAGEVLVVALPLADVDDAVDRLLAVQVVTTVVVLAVVALVTWWVVHLGVRPIKRMTETATAIAAGDLSRRVPDVAPGTEAGELGGALNAMLGRIEASFERQRRFAADASHELRTPITTIRGYAELHRAGALDDPAELAEAMRRTEQEAVRMGALVEDLLALARLDQGRPLADADVDLAELAADAARDGAAVAPGRPVRADAPAPVVVRGDEDRLRQVLANLVGNALAHGEGEVVVRAAVADGRARLEVRDEGPGMAPEVAARAFERFYRADPARGRQTGGAGLGLAIVDAVVAAHGGRASIDSAPGRGTVVVVELPLADPR